MDDHYWLYPQLKVRLQVKGLFYLLYNECDHYKHEQTKGKMTIMFACNGHDLWHISYIHNNIILFNVKVETSHLAML